ncbi:hypothetical protein [Microbacterium sp. CH-015]|uniref:hypothetical protein n=1 Tax=Microbacterium sp. CH-015 TaxID=3406734 RepID=UPI003C73501F
MLELPWLGQFNPPKVRVGTRRRSGRNWGTVLTLPDEDFTRYEGVPATTVRRATEDMRDRMPPDRWQAFVVQVLRRELIGAQDIDTRGG